MTMRRIAVTVVVDVDLTDYAQTYELPDPDDDYRAERDAAGYLETIVEDAVKQQVGEFKTLNWGEVLHVYTEGVA